MWLEHLLFGARFDTRLRGEFTRSVSPVQFSLFEIYGQRTAKRIVLQNIFSELKEDERRRRELPGGNDRLMSESDAEIGKKMKKSSLTSLRKDNEVKLEENY